MDSWSYLQYHLGLLDPRTFQGGQPVPGVLLPYDCSAIPSLEGYVPGDLGRVVEVHIGTRFLLDGLDQYLVVKGVDGAYGEVLDLPPIDRGRWLGSGGAGELVVPVGLAYALNLSIGESISLYYNISDPEELDEFTGMTGSSPPGISREVVVVGIHNGTDGVLYTGIETVHALMGNSLASYADVWLEEPSGLGPVFSSLMGFFESGDLYPSYRRAEMDSSPSAFLFMNGSIGLVWDSARTGDREIWLGILDEGNVGLVGVERVTNSSGTDKNPSVFFDAGGGLWVVFESTRSGSSQLWAQRREGGVWSGAVQLTDSGYANIQPSVLDGEVDRLVWVSYSNQTHGVVSLARLDPGGKTLSGRVSLGADHTSVRHPSLGFSGDGLVLLYSFIDLDYSGDELVSRNGVVSLSSVDGELWGGERVEMEGSVYDIHPGFFLDSSGESWLVWSSLRTTDRGDPTEWPNPEVWYRHTIDGEVLSPPRHLTDSYPPDFDPCLVEGGDGRIWVFWYSELDPFGVLLCSFLERGDLVDGDGSPALSPMLTFGAITAVLVVSVVLLLRGRPGSAG
jgi:hypothetical protein